MKKLLLISLLIPSLVFASVVGIGEYRYGPDTPENSACEFAEHRAREAAILKFFGEQIESFTRQDCVNGDCDFHDEIFRDVKGIIKKIISRQLQVIEKEGYRSCIVQIRAEVAPIENDLKFEVYGRLKYVHNETVDFSFVANKPGTVAFFYFDGKDYKTVYATLVNFPNTEQKIAPQKQKIVAQIKGNKFQTKELVAFLFTDVPIELKTKYTTLEMRNMISSIPASNRIVLYRYVTIVR
jgi:hypothetical protein